MNNHWEEDFEKIILQTEKLAKKLCEKWTHIYDCSWIIQNIISDKCRWYCVEKAWIPIICWKKEKCNNFQESNKTSKIINEYLLKNTLNDIY